MPEPRRAATGRPARRPATKREEESPGLFGRLAGLVAAHPAEAGGTLIAVVTLGAIIGNAAFLQTKRHPDPFFATRGAAVSAAPASAGPGPDASAATAGRAATPPLPQAPPSETEKARVAAIQRSLAALSLYGGPVDGLTGGRTKAAIVAYQRREGLAPDGEPTEALLERLRAAVPPPPQPRSAAEPPPAGTDAAATGSVPAPHPAPRDRGRVVALQAALNGLGYGPLDLDGRMGEATAEAIRRFELDNGMPISGLVDEDLIATMIRIGAMKPR
ncbi:peptidoglycan-binding protein [Prosthecomicrobium pneumaticum]|uniref:Peptidoglycan hydrolase-like protein with peptidoglycan-binding domain n=1 Tax=Prosthecomicrobium pneumaticum TaxID=81895 RepID=A0A7W9FJH3_9HYPH|nr:peptidoglycan hydrolase-like protein with peptidoglycan-binding domain [Prosthecomicrobium pneumaticum]